MGRLSGLTAILAAAVAVVAFPARALGAVEVTNTNDSGPGSLRQAIADASSGELINVPAGTITLTSGELVAKKDVVIAGAGAGRTVLSGGDAGRVLLVLGTASLGLSGVTVRDGAETGTGVALLGAGVWVESGAATIADSVFTANAIDADGGPGSMGGAASGAAIYAGGPLTMTGTRVVGNSASADGGSGSSGGTILGGAVWSAGPLTLTDSQVIGNTASVDGGSGSRGGTITGAGLDTAAPARLSGVNISENFASARGGDGPPSQNQTGGTVGGDGAFLGGPFTVTRSTISANTIDTTGGPGASGGNAAGAGLEIVVKGAKASSVENTTIASNSVRSNGGAARGGGVFVGQAGGGSVLLRNDTLAGNSVDPSVFEGGGNLFSLTTGTSAVEAVNTIVSGGVGPRGSGNCLVSGTFTSLGHNLDSSNECGFVAFTDKVDTDPHLGPPRDNGGPGPTLALAPSSPAFDAGDPAACPAIDERGVRRPQGAACDIGALELELPLATATSVACSPATVTLPASTSCTATVSDSTTPDAPTGTVAFTSTGAGSFGPSASCSLAASGGGRSACRLTFTPSLAGAVTITAAYSGANAYAASNGTSPLTVLAPPSGPVPPSAKPSNSFRLSRAKLNKRNGTATLTVTVPGPGRLVLAGAGIVRVARSLGRPGRVTLTVKVTGRMARRLVRTGRATVTARVTFTPAGGDPRTQSKKMTLKRGRR